MQKIIPHLWFDKEAKAAAEFHVAAFSAVTAPGTTKITSATVLHNTPSGDCDVMSYQLGGYAFMSIAAGLYFKTNPSISFMVNFDPSQDSEAAAHLDTLWNTLSAGGKIMMPLQEYPFSKRYGWCEDKFGVSWQLILTNPAGEPRPFIIPSLMFNGAVAGKAEEATDFYLSAFKNSKRGTIARYPAGMEPDKEGTLMFTDFQLEGQWFAAMDSAHKHEFAFTEGISLLVKCDTQAEIDHYWEKLSAVPQSEQCGWLKDKYGVSWQITPMLLNELMSRGTPEQIARVTAAFLKMKKFDIQKLDDAFNGRS